MISGLLNNARNHFFSKDIEKPLKQKDMLVNLTQTSVAPKLSKPTAFEAATPKVVTPNYDHIREDRRAFVMAINKGVIKNTCIMSEEQEHPKQQPSKPKRYFQKLTTRISEKVKPVLNLTEKEAASKVSETEASGGGKMLSENNTQELTETSGSGSGGKMLSENSVQELTETSGSGSGGKMLSENSVQELTETSGGGSGGKMLSENSAQELTETSGSGSGGKMLSENSAQELTETSGSGSGGKMLSENSVQELAETTGGGSGGGRALSEKNTTESSETEATGGAGGTYVDTDDDEAEDLEQKGTSKFFRSSVVKIQGSHVVRILPNGKKQILSKISRKRNLFKKNSSKRK